MTGLVQLDGSLGSRPVSIQRIARPWAATSSGKALSMRTKPSVMNELICAAVSAGELGMEDLARIQSRTRQDEKGSAGPRADAQASRKTEAKLRIIIMTLPGYSAQGRRSTLDRR